MDEEFQGPRCIAACLPHARQMEGAEQHQYADVPACGQLDARAQLLLSALEVVPFTQHHAQTGVGSTCHQS